MRLSTEIIRTPFGQSATADAMRPYGGTRPWTELQQQMLHQGQVESVRGAIPRRATILGETSGYRSEATADGGRMGEWWTVIVHDDVPLVKPSAVLGVHPGDCRCGCRVPCPCGRPEPHPGSHTYHDAMWKQ